MILSNAKRDILKVDADHLLKEVEILMVKLQFEDSLQMLQVLKNDYEILEDYTRLLKCHILSAACSYNLGDVKTAFQITNEYEALCEQYKIPINEKEYFPLLGLQYMYKGDLARAIDYYQLASNSAYSEKDYRLYVVSKKHIAYISIQTGQFDLGLQAIRDAKEVLSFIAPFDINHMEIILIEWRIYLGLDYLTDATEMLEIIQAHPLLTVDPVTEALYCEYHALYLFKSNAIQAAYTEGIRGIELLEGTQQYASMHDIYELLITISKVMNDPTIIIETYDRYIESLKLSQAQSFSEELTKREYEDLKKMTETDHLTGVYNRKYLMSVATEWLNTAQANGEVLICSVFDIDHFKQINDQYGHLVGDEILKRLAKKCEALIDSKKMFLARFGGDEFVIIYKENDLYGGLRHIQQLYEQFNDFMITVNGEEFELSLSIGVSHTIKGEYFTFERLFEHADIALYRSKENGRKMVTLY